MYVMKSTIAAATLHRSRQALAALAAKRQRPDQPTDAAKPVQPTPAAKPTPEEDLLQRLRESGL
jgi:hypothetical protein